MKILFTAVVTIALMGLALAVSMDLHTRNAQDFEQSLRTVGIIAMACGCLDLSARVAMSLVDWLFDDGGY
jgi:hypothetical protein